MRVTLDHPASSFGMPAILDDAGNPVDYAPGVKAIRARLGYSTTQLAVACGVSRRTVEDWEQGRRTPGAAALNVMGRILPDPQGKPGRPRKPTGPAP